jgi:hypothetical protein
MAKGNKSLQRQVVIGVSCGVLTVAVMVVMRDLLRNLSLVAYFSSYQLPVASQWSINAIFVVLFGAGLSTLYFMLHKVATATRIKVAGAQQRD